MMKANADSETITSKIKRVIHRADSTFDRKKKNKRNKKNRKKKNEFEIEIKKKIVTKKKKKMLLYQLKTKSDENQNAIHENDFNRFRFLKFEM